MCVLKFGSWSYDGFELDLFNLKDEADLSKYIGSGEWELEGVSAQVVINILYCHNKSLSLL